MDNQYNILEDAVRDMYARAVWSHKIQEKQADIYQANYKSLETLGILFASATSVGVLSIIFADCIGVKIISSVLSFATLFITIYFKAFDLNKMAMAHKDAANKLLAIRNHFACLITSIKLREKSISELEERYIELVNIADEVYKEAPSTTEKAVTIAKKALRVKGDNTFTDEEIDLYLPMALRKSENNI